MSDDENDFAPENVAGLVLSVVLFYSLENALWLLRNFFRFHDRTFAIRPVPNTVAGGSPGRIV